LASDQNAWGSDTFNALQRLTFRLQCINHMMLKQLQLRIGSNFGLHYPVIPPPLKIFLTLEGCKIFRLPPIKEALNHLCLKSPQQRICTLRSASNSYLGLAGYGLCSNCLIAG